MKHANLLEEITFIEPGAITKAHLDSVCNSKRYVDLSSFKRIGDKCGWCNEGEVRKSNAKYCSTNCKHSANFYCYPQHPDTKAWIFIQRQGCMCPKCGEIFEDDLDQRIERRYEASLAAHKQYGWKIGKVTYFAVGRLIGHLWQLDHVVPLWKGGRGIGLDNVQVICVKCHHVKTAEDLRTK